MIRPVIAWRQEQTLSLKEEGRCSIVIELRVKTRKRTWPSVKWSKSFLALAGSAGSNASSNASSLRPVISFPNVFDFVVVLSYIGMIAPLRKDAQNPKALSSLFLCSTRQWPLCNCNATSFSYCWCQSNAARVFSAFQTKPILSKSSSFRSLCNLLLQ